MKTPYYRLFLAILLCSCSKSHYYQLRINDIPTKAPNYNAEVRFVVDEKPITPYFELIDFNLIEKGKLNKLQVKEILEIEAIKEGIDAVIEVDYWYETEEVIDVFTILIDVLDDDNEPTTNTANFTHIRGRGIMYLENLDYINNLPEFEYFYKIDSNSGALEPFFKIEYKLTGQVYKVYPEWDIALEIFKKYFQYYSDYHLLKQREMWTYKVGRRQMKKRILRNDKGYISKICVPKYDENNRISELKIMNRSDKMFSEEFIYYTYDENGRLTKRLVELYDASKVFEDFIYESGQPAGRKVMINSPSGKQIILHSSIRFFDSDYLKDLYLHEIAQQK